MEKLPETTSTSQEGGISFKLQLNCLARKSSEIRTLEFDSFTSSVPVIKKAIEEKFSIPVCAQSLSYQGLPLTNDGSLLGMCTHIRSGDTLSVDYLCEAEVKLIDEIVEWVKEVTTALLRAKVAVDGVQAADAIINRGVRNKYDIVLALEVFDWLKAKAHVNKVFFKESGGLDAVLVLYETILKDKWEDMSQTYRYLETFCSHACANFGETFYFRRELVKRGVLDMARSSMLRVRMRIAGDEAHCDIHPSWSDEYSQYALKSILEYSLHTICKYAPANYSHDGKWNLR